MAIIGFWSGSKKETGQTVSIASIATQMAVEHNYRILLIDATFDDDTLERGFWKIEKKRSNTLENKINQTYKIITFITVPMVVGLSFLVEPVWNVFYGASNYGPLVYRYFVFVALFSGLFLQSLMLVMV